jgi:hypothetical protein
MTNNRNLFANPKGLRLVKKISLLIAAVLAMAACEKNNEPVDPIVKATKEFRDAFGPAKTDPVNISSAFNSRFNLDGAPETLADSVCHAIVAVRYMKADYGETSANYENMNILDAKAKTLQNILGLPFQKGYQ